MIKKYNQFIKENSEDSITVPGFTKEELDEIKETAMRLLSPGFHEDYEVGAYLSSVANNDPEIEKLLVKWLKSQGANFYQPEYRDKDDDYKMNNEEINLKGLAAGAMMALMTACNQGKVNGVSSEEYTGDMLVKKIEMDGHKHNFFVVHGLDKEGKSIEFATDNLTFNVGDSIHVDFESEKLYPLNDKDNKTSIQNYQ